MTPTPEQLAKLAEVAGIELVQSPWPERDVYAYYQDGSYVCEGDDWRPHEDIVQAWMVVEGMRERGYKFQCGDHPDRGWYAEFTTGWSDKCANQREDVAMPAAICAAALAALESP